MMNDLVNVPPLLTEVNDNDVVLAGSLADAGNTANILIVEHDADCADALETILTELPGIATVQTAMTTEAAFDLLDDGSYDVVGFEMTQLENPTPDIIFIGAHQPESDEVDLELQETLQAFRSRVPDAAIVLLSVYPNRYRDSFGSLIDGCIRKDTNARELQGLIDEVRAHRPIR